MRLWSLHPSYLDPQGLVALWREGLLAQAVLRGETTGYTRHPQLLRFRAVGALGALAAYLRQIHREAARRGYAFDASKISRAAWKGERRLVVTRGQLEYEWQHLAAKLARRNRAWLRQLGRVTSPNAHPLFRVIAGGVADWERVSAASLR